MLIKSVSIRLKKVNWYYFLIVLYSVWLLTILRRDLEGTDDFNVFYHSGKRLLNKENIYAEPHYLGLKYYYSVFFSMLMAFLQKVDITSAKTFWFIINFTAMLRLVFLINNYVLINTKNRNLLLLILLLLTGKIVLFNFTTNQVTILLTWLIIEAYNLLKKGWLTSAILLLCLGINIKILPIIVIPFFLIISHSKLKIIMISIMGLLFLIYLPALYIGWNYNNTLIVNWFHTINPISQTHILQISEGELLDIAAMGTKYLSSEMVANEPQINIISLSIKQLFFVTNILRILVFSSILWIAIKLKKPVNGIQHHFIILAAIMASIPLCFPHQRIYSFLFFLPVLAIIITLLNELGNTFQKMLFVLLILISGLLLWVDFVGTEIVDFYNLYRLTTIGMLFMLFYFIHLVLTSQNKGESS